MHVQKIYLHILITTSELKQKYSILKSLQYLEIFFSSQSIQHHNIFSSKYKIQLSLELASDFPMSHLQICDKS